jgi:hypothetical protein
MIVQRLLVQAGSVGIGHELVSVDGQGIEAAADWVAGEAYRERTVTSTSRRTIESRKAIVAGPCGRSPQSPAKP